MEKQANDGCPSMNEFYDLLILNQSLFYDKIYEMSDREVVDFYEYLLKQAPFDARDDRLSMLSFMEELPIVQTYLQEGPDMFKQEPDASRDKIVQQILENLERRKKAKTLAGRIKKFFKA